MRNKFIDVAFSIMIVTGCLSTAALIVAMVVNVWLGVLK